ncbi:hypothetical protein FCM35_KLT12992 [Carex littledalei]|uniref:Uncharacterized protein n=1 Tax=Carex littledalei TaxID=544730 RepID=A0A833QP21_9POAL|nr:hypothetical protein FCM35_KLT12992 [Carex littledalei]
MNFIYLGIASGVASLLGRKIFAADDDIFRRFHRGIRKRMASGTGDALLHPSNCLGWCGSLSIGVYTVYTCTSKIWRGR